MGGLWLCLVACGAFMAAGLQLLAQPRARRFPRGDAARARAPPALDEPRYALAALFPNPGRRPALPGPRATTSVYVPRFCRLPGGRVEFAATVGSFGALRRGALRFRNVLLTDVRSGAGDVAQHVWLRGDDALVVFAAVPEGAAFTFTVSSRPGAAPCGPST
ncbi:hypothetical protein M885DRAFT_107913 [Pelagophyceae sp. CCMP2097]|nr:hypothetical protein M885DRAFT_107913 [Pelagophyceae sp. CCMP2097]